jgi:hypothetical protein
LASGLLEEVHDVEFDETNGSQNEEDNLDDVRGTQLTNAMKEMDIGDIRPKQVIDVDDNKDQVLQSPIIQASGSLMQNQASTSSQVQQDQQVASSSSTTHNQHQHPSNQVQVLQPTNIARDHPLDSIIGDIQRGVQTRSRLASFYAHPPSSHQDLSAGPVAAAYGCCRWVHCNMCNIRSTFAIFRGDICNIRPK